MEIWRESISRWCEMKRNMFWAAWSSLRIALWWCTSTQCSGPPIAPVQLIRNCLFALVFKLRLWQRWFSFVLYGLGLWSLFHSHHIKVLQFQVETTFCLFWNACKSCLPFYFSPQTLSLTSNIFRPKLYQNIVTKITKFANVE